MTQDVKELASETKQADLRSTCGRKEATSSSCSPYMHYGTNVDIHMHAYTKISLFNPTKLMAFYIKKPKGSN